MSLNKKRRSLNSKVLECNGYLNNNNSNANNNPANFNNTSNNNNNDNNNTKVDNIRKPTPYLIESDFIDNLYQPHTITAGIAGTVAFLIFYRWHNKPNLITTPQNETINLNMTDINREEDNIKIGLLAAAWAFIVFSFIHLPDGVIARPHPMFWRGVLSLGVLYLCTMAFCLFVSGDTLRALLGIYDKSLMLPIIEGNYAEDCSIMRTGDPFVFIWMVCDVFVIAHSAGYWAKALILRDWRVVTALSIGFELVEVSLQHVLPNFRECWWDHIVCDIIICNGGGTMLGLLTLKYFDAKPYNWVKVSDIPSIKGKAKRLFYQFSPRRMDHFEWQVFDTLKRMLQCMTIVAIMLINEFNCFALKNTLNIPTTHHLVIGRIVMWGFIAVPGIRDFYDYCSDPKCKRLGTAAWIAGTAFIFETLVVFKIIYVEGHYRQSTPANVGIPLLLSVILFVVWTIMYYGMSSLRKYTICNIIMNFVFYSIPIILIGLFLMTNVDLEIGKKEFLWVVDEYGLW